MGKGGASHGYECEERGKRTGYKLKMGLAMYLNARERMYTQSESPR